jgi:hypothetical protein
LHRALAILTDLNNDDAVDVFDLEILLDNFGMSSPTQADGDLDGDGQINLRDLSLLLVQYRLDLAVAG